MGRPICGLLLFVGCFLFAPIAQAATLYIEPNETEIHPGDTISLAVRIDTDEDECINAVDGVIDYPGNIVPVDISRGESIFPMWVEDPTIDKENNRITFAGGIPNGYCGRIQGDPGLTNVILELIFQAPGIAVNTGADEPVANISFAEETSVYLNDGAGTQAPLRTLGSTIRVHDKPGNRVVDEWNQRVDADETPPNEFSVSLERDESTYGGRYFIVFNTTDKQSGIDHYEVIEEPIDQLDLFRFGAADAPWEVAKSPYVLEDQSLNSTIRVKAIDKAGNEYIATHVPDESMRGRSERDLFVVALGIGGVFVLLLVIGAVVTYRRMSRRRSGPESPVETE